MSSSQLRSFHGIGPLQDGLFGFGQRRLGAAQIAFQPAGVAEPGPGPPAKAAGEQGPVAARIQVPGQGDGPLGQYHREHGISSAPALTDQELAEGGGLEPPAGLDPGQAGRARQAEQLREARRRLLLVRQELALALEAAVHETLEDPAIARRMEVPGKGRQPRLLPLAQAPEAPCHLDAPCTAREEVPDDAAALLSPGLVPHEALQQPRIGMVFAVFRHWLGLLLALV